MAEHHTKTKGDLANLIAMADLARKGYGILTPLSEHLPFDFVAYKDGKLFKIQSKYSSDGHLPEKTSWSDKNGSHEKTYKEGDFDYYAIYLPDKDIVCYPNLTFKGATIRTEVAPSATPFYWYEDFLTFTDIASKKTYRDFGFEITKEYKRKSEVQKGKPRYEFRKVERPSKEELFKLLWEMPTIKVAAKFGVSDKAVEKWAKLYGIEKPPRGHWAKLKTNKD